MKGRVNIGRGVFLLVFILGWSTQGFAQINYGDDPGTDTSLMNDRAGDFGAPNPAQQPSSATTVQSTSSGPSCQSAHQAADGACNARDIKGLITAVAPQMLANTFGGNSMESSCRMARNMTVGGIAVYGAIELNCKRKRQACVTACQATQATVPGDQERLQQCQTGYERNIMMILAQARTYMDTLSRSQACLDAIARFPCQDPAKAYKNPECPQFCQVAANRQHAACRQVAMCDKPEYAGMTACICLRNPQDSRCPSTAMTNPSLGGNVGGIGTELPPLPEGESLDGLAGLEEGDADTYGGNGEAKGNAARTAFDDRGGGGGGPQGFGNSGGNPAGGGGGIAPGPFNTNIMGDGRSGGGGGNPFARGANEPAERNGGGFGRGFGGGLPGQGRLPANVAHARAALLFDQGITGANGLTNFEKVTRKMNEKRPKLLPP